MWSLCDVATRQAVARMCARQEGARRGYSHRQCTCRVRPPPGQCACKVTPIIPGAGQRIVPPADCTPGPVPLNPCSPSFHHGHDTYKKYKYIFFFVMVPLIIAQFFHAMGAPHPPPKGPCREYEYMRLRSKRFPWGDGTRSFFHNDHVNHLPSECEPPPLDCE